MVVALLLDQFVGLSDQALMFLVIVHEVDVTEAERPGSQDVKKGLNATIVLDHIWPRHCRGIMRFHHGPPWRVRCNRVVSSA